MDIEAQPLKSAFDLCAHNMPLGIDARAGGTVSEASAIDSLTLEFQESPFKSFLKEIEFLIETNPKQAMYLLSLATSEKIFDKAPQFEKLQEKMDEVKSLLQKAPALQQQNFQPAQANMAAASVNSCGFCI